jgi:hypothetical protein
MTKDLRLTTYNLKLMTNLIFLGLFFLLLGGEAASQPMNVRVGGVYRMHKGVRDGFDIWIVDGGTVRREIYPEFLFGGNPQRYLFVPRREIWVDNAVAAEEFAYTVAHELRERGLMAHKKISYEDAHRLALDLEHSMRRADDSTVREHERELHRVSPTDCDNVKEIAELPDSIGLHNIYRVMLGMRGAISVWVVDGAAVRRDIFPDFGLSGNDLAYHFIPKKEIWIDGQISCEETEFSTAIELLERESMAKGMSYNQAYEQAIQAVAPPRKKAAENARRRPSIILPKILDRDIGTGDEK